MIRLSNGEFKKKKEEMHEKITRRHQQEKHTEEHKQSIEDIFFNGEQYFTHPFSEVIEDFLLSKDIYEQDGIYTEIKWTRMAWTPHQYITYVEADDDYRLFYIDGDDIYTYLASDIDLFATDWIPYTAFDDPDYFLEEDDE